MSKIEVKINGDTAFLRTPYNAGFISAVKQIGGAHWTGTSWEIPANMLDNARSMMMRHYGETDLSAGEKINVRVKFVDECTVLCGPVTTLGRTLARATGRDSGAHVGEGVVLVSGHIGSCGSIKNWRSSVAKGTIFELKDVPRSLYDSGYDMYDEDEVIYEVVEETTDRKAALEEERQKLLNRIAEIDAELAKLQVA